MRFWAEYVIRVGNPLIEWWKMGTWKSRGLTKKVLAGEFAKISVAKFRIPNKPSWTSQNFEISKSIWSIDKNLDLLSMRGLPLHMLSSYEKHLQFARSCSQFSLYMMKFSLEIYPNFSLPDDFFYLEKLKSF